MEIGGIFINGYIALAGGLALCALVAWILSRKPVGYLKEQSERSQKKLLAFFGLVCVILALFDLATK